MDQAVQYHLEQNSLNDPATMADVGDNPHDNLFDDNLIHCYEDSTPDNVIMDECEFFLF